MWGKRHTAVAVAISSMLLASSATLLQAAEPDEIRMREIYRQILQDPGNADLNIRYAEIAIGRGELRKAVAAYERVLAQDPDNEAAQAGLARVQRLLQPNVTRVSFSVGGQYESNPFRIPNPGRFEHEGVFFGQGQIVHERLISETRWRAQGEAFANWHIENDVLDFGTVNASVGPLLPLNESWQVHPNIGAAYAWFDRRSFYTEVNGGLTLERTESGLFRSLSIKVRHDFITETFSGRDALIVDLGARFVVEGLVFNSDFTVIGPYYRYNGVIGSGVPTIDQRGDEYPLRYHQAGIRLDQFTRLSDQVTGNVNFSAEYRHYFETETFGTGQRRDLLLSPGAQLIVGGFPVSSVDLIVNYTFEWNLSNDGFNRYTNHIAGVRLLWRL